MEYYRLYLGRSRSGTTSGSHEVTDAELQEFLESVVSPAFDSYTIYRAKGYWKSKPERTFVLEIMTEYGQERINHIAQTYCQEFDQQAVMITQTYLHSYLVTPTPSRRAGGEPVHSISTDREWAKKADAAISRRAKANTPWPAEEEDTCNE